MIKKLLTPKNLRNLIIILVVSGVLFLAISGYLTPVFSVSVSPFISAQSWLSQRYLAFSDFFNSPRDMATLRSENARLENEVALLQSEIVALQENLAQSDILYTLLDFARTNPEHEYVAATVIGREISPYLQYIIIDKGSNDGLRHGMPVVTQQGLVGRIDALISDAARIQLITDANSTVNVKLQIAGVEGLVRGSVTGEIALDMVPVDTEVQIGEILMTSGLGGTYPPNIFVGQVLTMQSKQNVLFQTGSIQPVVDFSNLSAVLVITNFDSVDISPLVP
ncbi:MAG: rod shape-determining protein MreC [Anaerolineaceae bacterium]|jgi:rod shape-determining protein MreC|nr:rod shape-determining protein MreC [Anaerolineaceae bacterium]MDD4042236.1 rod shape-determining protein MreC [Anaerolineaceae bacterium]MDD4578693.1 rod shape-determining protein MreC [Anaerolineaceae bacterium]